MKTTAIFDLDGTLLDTLTDIYISVNRTLEKHKLPTHTKNRYKYFLGNGFEALVRRIVPDNIEGDKFIQIKDEINTNYRYDNNTHTKPYKGILDVLKSLNNKGVKLTVLSNKPHEFIKPTMEKFFPNIEFELCLGARKGIPIKPAPFGVFNILEAFNLKKEECLFIGDSETDIKTGVSAGVETVGVLWGFRTKEELIDTGANHVISSPQEIISLF